ncbi:hypothetical protein [Sporosarcina psychrophila]|uniref:Uncharacterized protein n=1 Tax=Sporosarcina psychrophila TaxID=1476 RepID=A0ABV2K497_SPOPS
MSLKRKSVIFFLTCFVIGSALFWYSQKESYSAEKIVVSAMDRYEVQSIQVGEEGVIDEVDKTRFVIRINVYDKNDIPKVESYLQKKLSKVDLAQYDIQVFFNKGITY